MCKVVNMNHAWFFFLHLYALLLSFKCFLIFLKLHVHIQNHKQKAKFLCAIDFYNQNWRGDGGGGDFNMLRG